MWSGWRLATAEGNTFCTATSHIYQLWLEIYKVSPQLAFVIDVKVNTNIVFYLLLTLFSTSCFNTSIANISLSSINSVKRWFQKKASIRQVPRSNYRPPHPSTSSTAYRCFSLPHKELAEETKSQAQADNRAPRTDPFHSARRPTRT